MAKRPQEPEGPDTNAEVVEDFFPIDPEVEYTEITPENDLPDGVQPDKRASDDIAAPTAASRKKAEPAPEEDEPPAEFKGKSQKELIDMIRNAQTLIGRQGSELGELRKTHDEVIRRSLEALSSRNPKPKEKEEAPPPDEIDFFGDPKTAVERAIASHPEIRNLKTQAERVTAAQIEIAKKERTAAFNGRHPDAGEILQDEGFREWVTKSPMRQNMLLRAHRNYDLMAAEELFGTWKELRALRNPKPEGEQAPEGDGKTTRRTVSRKPTQVPAGGGASPRQAGGKDQKIYSRAQIVRLMETDPEKYQSMADELTRAYAEGRVR